MAQQFVGKWKFEKMDNVESFMKTMGANEEMMKKAVEAREKEVIEFSINGGKYNFKSEVMKINVTFELGKEFEETGPMGKKSKNITTLEGDKLITESKFEDGKQIHVERRVEGNRLLVDMTCNGSTWHSEFVKM